MTVASMSLVNCDYVKSI